jgi:hypothetical protein
VLESLEVGHPNQSGLTGGDQSDQVRYQLPVTNDQ